MFKTVYNSTPIPPALPSNDPSKKDFRSSSIPKRARSTSPVTVRSRNITYGRRTSKDRRCQSLSPAHKKLVDHAAYPSGNAPKPAAVKSTVPLNYGLGETANNLQSVDTGLMLVAEKDVAIPQCVITKTMRILATRKREFIKMRKNLISLQNTVLEQYASLKELEARAGLPDDSVGDVRIISVRSWPAHDLLLLVRDDLDTPVNCDINGVFGPQVLQQLQAQLNPIPEEMLSVAAELMARRIEMLNLLRLKHRSDRSTYVTNLEWKSRNLEFDDETEQLHAMVAGTAENLKAKITYSLHLAKVPWIDRETLVKKVERLQKEIIILQTKIDEGAKKDTGEPKVPRTSSSQETVSNYQATLDELAKERAAREALKEVVSSAESMLRVARGRIATLERQLKENRTDLEAAKRRHKDLEQLYRHRETSYDARSKKLIEVSKTGEMTIEALSRQRDALENRVKELREQAEAAEKLADDRSAAERVRAETLQAKVAEQERIIITAELKIEELEARVKELEELLNSMRERSVRLVDLERRRCLEYVPSREHEPSDREVDIWKELQMMKVALGRTEEELRQSKADKDSFLESLAKIAQEEGSDKQDKLATELLNRERKIMKLQQVIEEQRENEKIMEQSMTEYENQLAALRLEIKRLLNYECYSKDIAYQDMQTELLELHMQVETLSRERSALVSAAASRALMLERHERAADLFARMIRARRELSACLEGRNEPELADESAHKELSRSLSSVCTGASDTWTALRVERARVLRLEKAVLAQSLQLDREARVRTQLERRRALLEREILRSQHPPSSQSSITNPKKHSINLVNSFKSDQAEELQESVEQYTKGAASQ